MKKTLDKTAVLVVAVTLLQANSNTTTLEVKNELRKQGYDARQSEISNYMSQLATEENWDVDARGPYKTFAAGTTGLVTATIPVTGTKGYKVTKSGNATKVTATVLATKVSGCWELNSTTSSTVVYVDGSVSREKARTAYMNEVAGTIWADTRSRRVK